MSAIWVLALFSVASLASSSDFDLPVLGDTSSALISPQQEYELGQAWLGAFRSRVSTLDDPELQIYLETLLFELAQYSDLNDHRLELIIVNNPTLNAFAVPGGIIGVHTGLFRYTENEHQLASVLTHELAHLSQRHFARGLQNRKASSVGTMAGLLTGIILAATVGGDAGMAAMTMTQAAALENSLRYSRQNEQEADRLGINTLFKSGRDPAEVSNMFEQMLAATRYTGQKPPEFLLTHPLTEKRVADARGRISNYPQRQYPLRPQFDFMRARAMLRIDDNPSRSVQRFKSELEGFSTSKTAAAYGLALAYSRLGNHEDARQTLEPLLAKEPKNLILRLAEVELETNGGNYDASLERIEALETLHASHYALQRYKAETLLKAGRYQQSERVLAALTGQRPKDPKVWFQLAEVSGLSGNIVAVHKARAEFFILIGVYDKAREQLSYAQRLVANDFREHAILETRIEDVNKMIERIKQL
ncbi:MAG: M48 family metalloprotease [Porticoccaceae bacterium]|nr:M48 family metalloprotease [Porticoccaceae bacterium]